MFSSHSYRPGVLPLLSLTLDRIGGRTLLETCSSRPHSDSPPPPEGQWSGLAEQNTCRELLSKCFSHTTSVRRFVGVGARFRSGQSRAVFEVVPRGPRPLCLLTGAPFRATCWVFEAACQSAPPGLRALFSSLSLPPRSLIFSFSLRFF